MVTNHHVSSLSSFLIVYLLTLIFHSILASQADKIINIDNDECSWKQQERSRGDDVVVERIVVLKLGGSSITDKASLETLDQSMLDWIASTLSNSTHIGYNSCNENEVRTIQNKFVIVHGAGSFGHHIAKKYGLKGGHTIAVPSSSYNEEPSDTTNIDFIMEGLAQTRLSVTKLNWHVVQTLLKHSLPAVGVSPFAVGLQAHGDPLLPQNERDTNIGADPMATLMHVIQTSLQVGLIPVLHGDAVLYGHQSGGILSGDTLVSQITVRSELTDSLTFRNSQQDDGLSQAKLHNNALVDVVFLTDVNGVYTSDPKIDSNAKLIPLIEVDAVGNIVSTGANGEGLDAPLCDTDESLSPSSSCASIHEHDVTGGLRTKLQSAIEIAKTGIPVYILKCGSTDATRVIRGEPTFDRGTLIRLAT